MWKTKVLIRVNLVIGIVDVLGSSHVILGLGIGECYSHRGWSNGFVAEVMM